MPFHVEPSDGNPVSDVHQDKETDHEGIQPPTVKEGRRERRHPQAQLAAGGQQAIRRQPPELPAAPVAVALLQGAVLLLEQVFLVEIVRDCVGREEAGVAEFVAFT